LPLHLAAVADNNDEWNDAVRDVPRRRESMLTGRRTVRLSYVPTTEPSLRNSSRRPTVLIH